MKSWFNSKFLNFISKNYSYLDGNVPGVPVYGGLEGVFCVGRKVVDGLGGVIYLPS